MKKKEENLNFGTRYNVVQKKQGHSAVGRSANVGEQTEIKCHLKENAGCAGYAGLRVRVVWV